MNCNWQAISARARRRCGILALVLLVPACTTLSALDSASRALPSYELRPPAARTTSARIGGGLFVDVPVSMGAFGTERVIIKPSPLEVAYLPDARWIQPAPEHIQSLLAQTLSATGAMQFVTTRNVGPLPDYTLLTDIEAFQAEAGREPSDPVQVRTALTLSVVRDRDSRLIASRRFERSAVTYDGSTPAIISAFDAAMRPLLAEASAWVAGTVSGGGT